MSEDLKLTEEDRKILDSLAFWFAFGARFGWLFKVMLLSAIGGAGVLLMRVAREFLVFLISG